MIDVIYLLNETLGIRLPMNNISHRTDECDMLGDIIYASCNILTHEAMVQPRQQTRTAAAIITLIFHLKLQTQYVISI